ncbi:MAG: sensor histidine kinase, partial [Anaerolineales bacterium]
TVLRQSREQLRALSGRLQAAREEERTLMAREIHDRLGGDLTALKIDLAWLQSRVRGRNQNAMLVKLNTMSALLDDSIQAVRKIATELRPGILDDLGLIAAIEWQLNEFQARTGVACAFTTGLEDSPIDPDGTTTLFRILQEALTNIARHANATRVEVGLEPVPSYLVLSVRDNGRGINEAEINSSHSLGLLGMRERARLQAGDLQVAGRPGQGTTITVRLPIRSQGLAEESLGDPSPAC